MKPALARPTSLPKFLTSEEETFLRDECAEATFSPNHNATIHSLIIRGSAYDQVTACDCGDLRLFGCYGNAYAVCEAHGFRQLPGRLARLYHQPRMEGARA